MKTSCFFRPLVTCCIYYALDFHQPRCHPDRNHARSATQQQIYGQYPLKAALDGGFASKANLKIAKDKGIKDVCFAKKRGLDTLEMCRSEYVYKRLRRFRAGIESGISWLKRSFGLTRCTWKGWRSFKSYVWASIVSANLLTIARKQLA